MHIPFCACKCAYCDFLSYGIKNVTEDIIRRYVDALCQEIAILVPDRLKLSSVFIGGGTPSILPIDCIGQIMRTIANHYDIYNAEITMETNPGTLTKDGLYSYRDAGINRLSIGIQSLNDQILHAIIRIHSAEQGIEAVKLAQEAGFDNLNVDLMTGLPGQTKEILLKTLQNITELNVQHISLYSLIVEENTPLNGWVEQGKIYLPDDEKVVEMQRMAIQFLQDHGFLRYEISNFAKEGFQCTHNLQYWQCQPYLAAGLGACSARYSDDGDLVRYRNETDLFTYIRAVEDGYPVSELEERVDLGGQMFEFMMLGLRLCKGVSKEEFQKRFGADIYTRYAGAIDRNIQSGLLQQRDGQISLTEEGLLLQNRVLLDFME